MERAIRAIVGAIGGLFIMAALFQSLLAVPELSEIMDKIINGLVGGLIIGAVISVIVGIIFLYIAITRR